MKFVEDWRRAWRWFSVHALITAGAIPSVWVNLPGDLKDAIPPEMMGTVTAIVAVCGLIGRMVNQKK
ncbi:hypothetical protein EAS17NKHM_025520 [Enterobacter asburiae]|uniref:DUF7940 domain-containing protein n=1 Tax=Enterobacter asburiae TaxID=61645 RepID=UPI00091CA6BF|nr:hypothetical protein [Enterobacter asburiae]BBJ59156.1 hypothetical protein EAS17NKHM_025520 [Enterobacter asburiae]SHI09876.1 hypothetical protein SAMN05428958_11613 [Pantoea sesami]